VINKIIRIPFFFLIFLVFISCSSKMKVEDARQIALKFHGTINKMPPRALGNTINSYVKEYKDAKELMDCPSLSPTDDTIEWINSGLGSNGPAWWRLQDHARRQYYNGNIEYAIIYADAAAKNAEAEITRAECLFDKARYLAEGGDFIRAKRTLYEADWIYYEKRTKRPETDERWILKRAYLSAHAKATVRFAMGDMEGAKNNYKKALDTLVKARDSGLNFTYAWRNHLIADLNISIAKCLLWQGHLVEAEIFAREALSIPFNKALPLTFITLSRIFYEQGRYVDAEITAKTALNMLNGVLHGLVMCTSKNALIRARARQSMALAFLANGKWNDALKELNTIQKEMETVPETYHRVFDETVEKGLALLMTGKPTGAIKQFLGAKRKLLRSFGENHYTAFEADALIAIAEYDLGHKNNALRILDLMVPKLLEKWNDQDGNSTNTSSRLQRLEHIAETYIELLYDKGTIHNIEKAFKAASAFQTRSVGKAIAASSARLMVQDQELIKLLRSQQDLEMQLSAHQNRLAAAFQTSTYLKNKKVIRKLQMERDELKKAIDILSQEIQKKFPDYSAFTSKSVDSIEEVRQQLLKDESLLSIFVGKKATYIWILRKNGKLVLHKSDLGRLELNQLILKIRQSIEPAVIKTVMDVPAFDLKSAYLLYQNIFEPLDYVWKPARNIVVVTNSPLDQIPFSLFPVAEPVTLSRTKLSLKKYRKVGVLPVTETPDVKRASLPFEEYRKVSWIARTHAITYLPSVSSFIQLRSLKPKENRKTIFAGFGDPWFNEKHRAETANANITSTKGTNQIYRRAKPQTRKVDSAKIALLPRLPETDNELKRIAEALGADPVKTVFTGDKATESQIKQMDLSNHDILVFATHGLVPGDLDGLYQPALALTSPSVTGEQGNDGLLTMGEIMWMRLNANWVVLSACNTAAAGGAGAEAVSGLGQAFFYAGARSLLVTSWPVETTSAMALTTTLFSQQAKDSKIGRAEALRQAKISLIDNLEGRGFTFAHPLFWSPFIIVGDGGKR